MLRGAAEDGPAGGGGGLREAQAPLARGDGVEMRPLARTPAMPASKTRDDAGSPRRMAPAARRRAPWRTRLGVRPLIGASWLPWEVRELAFAQIFVLALVGGGLAVLVASESLPWLSEAYCRAHTSKPYCDVLAYRLAKAGRHLGAALHLLTAANFLLVCRRPLYAVFGLSIERLAKWHRWTGHLVVIGSVLHGAGFYSAWIVLGTWNQKFFKSKNFAGTCALAALLVLWALSLEPVRRGLFAVFYRAHVICVPLYVLGLVLHHEAGQFLLLACVPFALLLGDKLWRGTRARRLPWRVASVRPVGQDTLCLSVEPEPLDGVFMLGLGRLPATSWVSINIPALSRWQMHPFSVCNSKILQRKSASDPDVEPPAPITIYSRAPAGAGRWTRSALALGQALVDQPCYVDGPYGGLELPLPLASYDAIVFAAGGIGITPLLPVFEEMANEGLLDAAPCVFIFTTSDASLVDEFAPALRVIAASCEQAQVRIHLTDAASVRPMTSSRVEDAVIEAQDGAQAVDEQSQDLAVTTGRPSFSDAAADVLAGFEPGALIAGLCCGPASMDRAFMQATAAVARSQRVRVHFHREGFGL